MNIGFLVYDSRSGSTLLSDAIVAQLQGVAVTQEIGFEHLLASAARGGGRITREAALRSLQRDYLRNLGLSGSELRELVAERPPEFDVADLMRDLLGRHLRRQGRSEAADWVLIKYGKHVLQWEAIAQVWGRETHLLHIVRDPRAVAASKLRTARPYYPFETFAWGGSAVAAARWRSYCRGYRRAAAAGLPALELRYEDLVADADREMDRLAAALDAVRRKTAATDVRYVVPAAEKSIHVHVGRAADATRLTAWRDELSLRDWRCIEALAAEEMQLRGYVPEFPCSAWGRAGVLAASAPDAAWRVAAHYLRHAWRRCAPPGKAA